MKPRIPPLPCPLKQSETYPAFVVGGVRSDHDFAETVAAVVKLGLIEDTSKRFPKFGQFAGHVATEEVMAGISAHPGVEDVVPLTAPLYPTY